MIVDTSMEIAGDNRIPHEAVGSSRRMSVKHRAQQYEVLVEAAQNHTPEVIVVDEIGNPQEVKAVCSIAERGVQLIASVHGTSLENVLNNPDIKNILGRVDTAAVSDKNAEKTGEKFLTKRLNNPAFGIAIEVLGFGKLAIHHDVKEAVDSALAGETLRPEQRWVGFDGEICKRDEPDLVEKLRSRFANRE